MYEHARLARLCLRATSVAWSIVGFSVLCPWANCWAAERFALLRDGQSIQTRFVGLRADGQLRFEQAGTALSMPPSELVVWGTFRDREHKAWIILSDGGILVADILAIGTDEVVIAGSPWSQASLPRRLVRAVILRPPLQTLERDQLYFRAANDRRDSATLLFENGDELAGDLAATVTPAPGAFHPEEVGLTAAGRNEEIKIRLERVVALLFPSDAMARTVPAAYTVGFHNGSRLHAKQLRANGKSLELELNSGAILTTEPSAASDGDPWNLVTMLQPLASNITYLSDIEPVGYKHIPFLDHRWPYYVNRSVSGGQLRHSAQVVSHGIGMHSSSRLAFDVGSHRWLHGELAIDERAGLHGSVVFRVYLQDRDGSWTQGFESDVVRGGDRPVDMRVDVREAERIALIVDFADRADQWDHANWFNLRLVK